MSVAFARAVSLLGHPVPVLSVTLLALAAGDGAARGHLLGVGATLALTAIVILGYSRWQVRRGDWQHVDASQPRERGELNRFLFGVLLAGTALAGIAGMPLLALQLGLAALLVALAVATARWCKLSLHLAFALYAAMLLAPASWLAAATLLLLAALLAWSRLQLQRHAPRDLVAGAVAGVAAGLLAHYVAALAGSQG
jgi:hypothetical protein